MKNKMRIGEFGVELWSADGTTATAKSGTTLSSAQISWATAGGSLTLVKQSGASVTYGWVDGDTVYISFNPDGCGNTAYTAYGWGLSGGHYTCECADSVCTPDTTHGDIDVFIDSSEVSVVTYMKPDNTFYPYDADTAYDGCDMMED